MIEALDRSLFELVADSRGRILDIDPQLVELLPPPGANYVDQIFYNFASDATHVQNVTMKTKFPYQLHAQLIPRGKIEQETVHLYDVQVLHSVTGMVKTNRDGGIYSIDDSLCDSLLWEMSEKPFALNLFDFLELTDEVPVNPRTPMTTRRKIETSGFGSSSPGPIADRLRHRPSQNESLKSVPSAAKLAELTHYNAWFDIGIYHVRYRSKNKHVIWQYN